MKKNEFRLDIPDDCDHTVTDRITDICPVFDKNEKEKIFAMSERKYNKKKNTLDDSECEDKVRGVEFTADLSGTDRLPLRQHLCLY